MIIAKEGGMELRLKKDKLEDKLNEKIVIKNNKIGVIFVNEEKK